MSGKNLGQKYQMNEQKKNTKTYGVIKCCPIKTLSRKPNNQKFEWCKKSIVTPFDFN